MPLHQGCVAFAVAKTSSCASPAAAWRLRIRPLLLAMLLVTHFPDDLCGQSIAEIRGVVQDESGGMLPGVSVTITDQLTGAQRTTVSDDAGRFNFPRLLVGTYRL